MCSELGEINIDDSNVENETVIMKAGNQNIGSPTIESNLDQEHEVHLQYPFTNE